MIGKTISHYRILEKLGEGGMGVVYRAKDTKLDRTVALKFLPPELTRDSDAKRRFVHEAKAASALQHHNICTIHEIDESDEGHLFIAMDCYEGETLKHKIARGPLAADEAIDIMSQVAEGLAKAHEAGMVHRDIKPANIMVTKDGVVKIMDFGLAKLAGRTKVTKTGMTVGTVAYMSPEQARGEEMDARSDIFSLGVTLYEMLAGEPPFKGEHEAALLYEVVHQEPKPLSTCRSDLPEDSQLVVDRMLKKEPGERYQSVLDLKGDLDKLKESSTEGKSLRAERNVISSFLSSRSKLFGVIGVTAAAIVLIVFASIQFRQRSATPSLEELSLAIIDFRNLVNPEDPVASAEITGLLHVGLVEACPIRVVSPDLLHDLRRRFFGSARGPIAEDQVLEVARKSGSTIFLSGDIKEGQYAVWRLVDTRTGRSLAARRVDGRDMAELANLMIAEVLPLVSREYGIEETLVAPSVTTITTASTEAYKHFVAGTLAREEWQPQNAVPRFEQALEYDSTFALALFKLSQAHFESGTRGEVVNDYADKAWELRTRLGIKDGLLLKAWRERLNLRPQDALSTYQAMLTRWPDDREILGALAQLLFYFWYFDEAGEVAERGLSLYPDDVIITSVGWSSLVYSGHMEEALASIRAFIARNPTKVNGWEELGWRYLQMGQADSAEVAFRQVLEIDPNNFWTQWGIGNCHYQRGDLNRALETFERILSRSDLLSGQRVDLMTNLRQSICLSWIHAAAGRFGKALEVFEEAQQLVSDPEYDARVERNRAWLLLRMRRAEEVLLAARALAERDVGRYALAKALENSARALVRLDSLQSARRTLQEYLDAAEQWRGSSEYTSHKVSAEIALAEGNAKGALGYLEEMKLYGAPYFEGLLGIEYREDLARAYRLAGRLDEAADVLRELLRIHGGHALAHYELGQILEEMGRAGEAEKEYSTFLRAWADADEGLPQVEDARTRLAALRAGS